MAARVRARRLGVAASNAPRPGPPPAPARSGFDLHALAVLDAWPEAIEDILDMHRRPLRELSRARRENDAVGVEEIDYLSEPACLLFGGFSREPLLHRRLADP